MAYAEKLATCEALESNIQVTMAPMVTKTDLVVETNLVDRTDHGTSSRIEYIVTKIIDLDTGVLLLPRLTLRLYTKIQQQTPA